MQPPHSLTAVSIGAIIALCPIETTVAQTVVAQTPRSVSVPSLSESHLSKTISATEVSAAQTSARQIYWSSKYSTSELAAVSKPSLAVGLNHIVENQHESQVLTVLVPVTDAGSPPVQASSPVTPDADRVTVTAALTSSPNAIAAALVAPALGDGRSVVAAAPTPPPGNDSAPTLPEVNPTVPLAQDAPAGTTEPVPAPVPPTSGITEPAPAPTTGDGTSPSTGSSLTPAAASPAPEYLNPSPNPLLFPTQPGEVEIVGTQPISLRQALELAQRNSPQLRQTQQELERARAALRQAEAANLPTLDLSASLTQNQQQTQQGRQNQNGSITNSTITTDSTTLNGQLQVNYDLFTSGSRSATIRASQQQVRFQELQLEVTAEDLRQRVTRAYYDVQDADEQVRISQASVAELQRSLQDTQAQERAGIGTRFDVLQTQVDLANSQQQLTQRLSTQRINRRQLVQILNLTQSVDISAADPVVLADVWNLSLEQSVVLAYRNRAELEQQLVQRDISEQQKRAALAAVEPQISLFANYGAQNRLNSGDGFFRSYQLGAQFNWRLFDGGAASASADQQEANISIAESQFENLRTQVRFQVEQAYLNLQANFDNIQTATLAQSQASEALRLARLRFQAGVGIQSDTLRAQTQLTQAEVNRVEAILGYNRSLIDLQRAVSNFPDGNLADSP
jgi:outer membrane protein TolC